MASVQGTVALSRTEDRSSDSVSNEQACVSLQESDAQYFGFNQPSKKTDLTLLVEGKSIFVTRAVLELMSPVFQDLLDSNEGNEQLELPDKTYGDFVEFLACFYPGKNRKITDENVFRMLPLADEYDIYNVKNQCELCLKAMLETSTITTKMLVYCIQTVYTYKYESLKSSCVKNLEKLALDDIGKFNKTGNLPDDFKVELYDKWVHKYRYLYAGLSKQRATRMAEWDDVVQYFTLQLCINIDSRDRSSKRAKEFGLGWSLETTDEDEDGVSAYIKCYPGETSRFVMCEGEVTFAIANFVNQNEPWKKATFFQFTPSNSMTRSINLEPTSDSKRQDAGFLSNGKFIITAHVLLRKPVFSL